MTLVGKTCFRGDGGKAVFSVTQHFNRPLQSQMNDVAVRADANRAGERTRKMKLAPVRHFCKTCDIERFVQMLQNKFLNLLEYIQTQQILCLLLDPHSMKCRKGVDKTASRFVPKHGT